MHKKKYVEMKLYLNDEETKREFRKIIVDFDTADKTIKAFISAYKTNPLMFKPKFI